MPMIDGKYKNPNWVNGGPPAINAAELNAISDTLEALDAGGGSGDKTPYIVIGTSQNGWTINDCDYLCDGVADQEEINAALEQTTLLNKDIFLLAGTYSISAPIIITRGVLICSSIQNFVTGIYPENSSVQSLIEIDSTFDVSFRNLGLGNLISPSPATLALIRGKYETSIILDNVVMMSEMARGIVVPSTYKLRLHARNSAICNSTLSLSDSDMQNCVLTNVILSECGDTISRAQSIFMSNNIFDGSTEISNSARCVFLGNTFYQGFSLTNCTQTNFSSNYFYDGGITLDAQSTYSLIVGNGGASGWTGVTDNGSNNFVANNMPTT